MRMKFDVEDEFAEAIKAVGGVRVSQVLGSHPSHLNADFAFIVDAVVAELKCLEKDQINDDGFIEKVADLYIEELMAGKAPVVAFGDVHMTTAEFSDEYARKVADLYRIPIERVVKKAAKQISQTATALKLANPVGLLLVANDNHSALDPVHLKGLLHAILSKPDYASIDAAIMFSGNLPAAVPGSALPIDYWITLVRPGRPVTNDFLERLRGAWVARLGHIYGATINSSDACDVHTLTQLESRRRTHDE